LVFAPQAQKLFPSSAKKWLRHFLADATYFSSCGIQSVNEIKSLKIIYLVKSNQKKLKKKPHHATIAHHLASNK
jgi:hypothetical protein